MNTDFYNSTKQTEDIYDSYAKLNMMNVFKSNEKYKFSLKKEFETACWCYINDTHNITVGDQIFERVDPDYDDYSNVVYKYIVHEAGHACFTSRDLEALSKKLEQQNISFQLFNLFEDARIEHLMRVLHGVNFNWTDFEPIPEDKADEKALTTFFKIIQTENRNIFDVPYYERVIEYYTRSLEANTDEKMIDLLKEWIKEFPNEQEPNKDQQKNNSMSQDGEPEEGGSPGSKGKSEEGKDSKGGKSKGKGSKGKKVEMKPISEMSDLEIAAAIASSEEFKEKFEEDIEVIIQDAESAAEQLRDELGLEEDTNSSVKILGEVKCLEISTLAATDTETLFDKEAEYNPNVVYEDKIDEAKKELKRILRDVDTERVNQTKPSNYFNIKGVLAYQQGDARSKLYKTNIDEDEIYSKKKVFQMIDTSGSMKNHPIRSALTLSVVLNRLCKEGLFEGYISGSKERRGKAIVQGFQLPVNDGMITSLKTGGAEGLGYAINRNSHLMSQCDYVFIITDGHIHDLNLDLLKINHPEIYQKTVGIYVGDASHSSKNMSKWFRYSIINNDFLDTVKDIAKLLDPNVDPTKMINAICKDLEGNLIIEEKNENFKKNEEENCILVP